MQRLLNETMIEESVITGDPDIMRALNYMVSDSFDDPTNERQIRSKKTAIEMLCFALSQTEMNIKTHKGFRPVSINDSDFKVKVLSILRDGYTWRKQRERQGKTQ